MFSLIAIVAFVSGVTTASAFGLDPYATNNQARIINGEDVTDVNAYPHQLTLLRDSYHTCGASLISPDFAITAAHCVDGAGSSNFSVAGNFIDFSATAGHFRFYVSQIIMHENYHGSSGGFPNDIALLRLYTTSSSASIAENHSIRVANDGDGNFANVKNCVITGWGNTVSGSTSVMKVAEVEVLTTSQCKSAWSPSGSSILDTHVCVWGATGDRSGACNGDSGGPLTCYSGGQPVLAGLTSWGRSGCHVNGVVQYPSVYTRTSSYYDWINDNCGNCIN